MHFLWDIGQDLAASAVRSSLYQYPRGNYNWVCTKVNLKYDFHITGQLMENHPEYSGSPIYILNILFLNTGKKEQERNIERHEKRKDKH